MYSLHAKREREREKHNEQIYRKYTCTSTYEMYERYFTLNIYEFPFGKNARRWKKCNINDLPLMHCNFVLWFNRFLAHWLLEHWWLNNRERVNGREWNPKYAKKYSRTAGIEVWKRRVSKKSSYSTQSKHQRCFMPFHSPNLIYIVLLCEHTHTYTLDNFRSKSVGMHVFERARQRIFIILIETWCKWFQAPPCVSTVDTSVCAFSLHFCSVLPWIFILWPPFYMLHDSRACVWILSHFISTDVANRKCTQAGAPMFASQKKPHHAHAKMRNRKSIFFILFYFMTDLAWYKQVSHTHTIVSSATYNVVRALATSLHSNWVRENSKGK